MTSPPRSDSSVLKEWWESTTDTFTNLGRFWKQRRDILGRPAIAVQGEPDLAYKPLKFALHIIVVPAVVISAISTALNYVPKLPPLPLDREIATLERAEQLVTEAAREGESLTMPGIFDKDFDEKMADIEKQNEKQDNALKSIEGNFPFEIRMSLAFASLGTMNPALKAKAQLAVLNSAVDKVRAQQRNSSLIEPINRFIVPISLVATAMLFRIFLSRYKASHPLALKADQAYLYYVSARLFFPNAIALVGLYAIELLSRFTTADQSNVTSVKELLVFVCGIWGLVALILSATVLRTILGFDAGATAGRKHLVLNRLLLASMVTGITTFAFAYLVGRAILNIV